MSVQDSIKNVSNCRGKNDFWIASERLKLPRLPMPSKSVLLPQILPWANHQCDPLFSPGLNFYCSPTQPAFPASCPTDGEQTETFKNASLHVHLLAITPVLFIAHTVRSKCVNLWYLCCPVLRVCERWFKGAWWVGGVCIGIDRGRTSLLHLSIRKQETFIPLFIH